MNEDWEQVTPFLQDMQQCSDDDYFNPQEVSLHISKWAKMFIYEDTYLIFLPLIMLRYHKSRSSFSFCLYSLEILITYSTIQ